MATLVLTAIGTVVGGPIGAAVGAIVGQQIDNRLFAPKPRQGARLGELAVQTSSYGSAIPKIFGTMRVAGTVIWSTDLIEERTSSGGGKGQPRTISYSYSAAFAVALSGRPIRSVRRIWADGKLLRGAGGDFKSATKFRLYTGTEDQPVDPYIAAAEGMGQTPAYLGIAYAMFEDFQLADYGNRIPSLTFEVVADPGDVTIGAIAEALSGGEVADGVTPQLGGYAATGDSVRGALEGLGEIVPLSLPDEGDRLRITTAPGAPVLLSEQEIGAQGAGSSGGRTEVSRRAAGGIADEVSITYYDPARDYQTGLQRATRSGASSRADRRSLPAALLAPAAKGFAERRLAALWAGRTTARLHLGWRRSGLRPGALVRLEGQAGIWKVQRSTFDRMVVGLELIQAPGTAPPLLDATPGRPLSQPDLLHGPTTLQLLDLPLYGEFSAERPQLLVAAAGAAAGWRRAELIASYDDGASWHAAGSTAAPAVMGTALTALNSAGSELIDMRNFVDVELLNDRMWLEARNDAALANGWNLALIGRELFQFGEAVAIGERKFRLSRLLRGRRGTEWAAAVHGVGDRFVLIERSTLAVVEPPREALGGQARLLAVGIGDGDGVEAACGVDGDAMRPPAPVHLAAETNAAGDLPLRWVRRSRHGWSWLSGSDTPLGEEVERYRVTLLSSGFERAVTVSEPFYNYTYAEQAEDGVVGALTIHVEQLGTFNASRRATLIVS